MKSRNLNDYMMSVDHTISAMDKVIWDVDDRIQTVFSKHVVLAGAGLIENAVSTILYEYCKNNSNRQIQRFVSRSVERQNSLNCQKIREILDGFDKEWWLKLKEKAPKKLILSVDSLKTLRDQVAHGEHNGTNYSTVRGYFDDAKKFIGILEEVVNS